MPDRPDKIDWIMADTRSLHRVIGGGDGTTLGVAMDIRDALLAAGYRIELDPNALLARGKEDVPSGTVS